MARENEAAVEAHLRRVVKRLGGYTMKLVPSDKGAPDRLVLLPGGIIRFVELKRVGGQVSPAQLYWADRAEGLGTAVDVVIGKGGVDRWGLAMEAAIRARGSSTDSPATRETYRG